MERKYRWSEGIDGANVNMEQVVMDVAAMSSKLCMEVYLDNIYRQYIHIYSELMLPKYWPQNRVKS